MGGSLILLGLVMLAVGGEAMVRGATRLARIAGLTPAVIGLTVVAIGTSLPELTVSVAAGVQGRRTSPSPMALYVAYLTLVVRSA
jgi:cation:H+ antiporter